MDGCFILVSYNLLSIISDCMEKPVLYLVYGILNPKDTWSGNCEKYNTFKVWKVGLSLLITD